MNSSQIIIIILLIFLLVLSAILIAISSKLYTINNYIKKGGMIPIDRMKEFLRNHEFDQNDAEAFCIYLSNIYATNTLTEFAAMGKENCVLAYQNWKDELNSQQQQQPSLEIVPIERKHMGQFKMNNNNISISTLQMDDFRKYLNGDGKYLSSDFVDALKNGENDKCLEIYNIFKEWEDQNKAQSSRYTAIVPPQQAYSDSSSSGYAIVPQQLTGSVSIQAITNFFRDADIRNADADSFLNYVNSSGFANSDIEFIDLGLDQRKQLYDAWKEESRSSSSGYAIMPSQQEYNDRGEIIQTKSIDNDLRDLSIEELQDLLNNARGRIGANYDYKNSLLPNPTTREDDEYIIQKIPEIIDQKRRSI